MNRYNSASGANPYLQFTFSNDNLNRVPLGLPAGYGSSELLHCRIDGHLAAECLWSAGQVVTMYMPLDLDFTANVEHLVSISTRGADYSATRNEGLRFLNAG